MKFERTITPVFIERSRRRFHITIEFENGRLSMVGHAPGIWGQCREVLTSEGVHPVKGITQDEVLEIKSIWDRWHLNDMNPGTPRQMKFVRALYEEHPRLDYREVCRALDSEGLLIDDGYRYGTKWLFEPVPDNVIKFLFSIEPGEGSTWKDIQDWRVCEPSEIESENFWDAV